MSQLYIRVRTGFYTNRKTVKLRSKIGADANWIPPRLWAYAAENQPDGNISSYTSEEIAELVGCPKYATSILQALKDCGFVDESGMIHDWSEHNGYHEKFSHRATIAANARWSKEKSPTPPKEEIDIGKGKGETSIASSMLVASSALSEIPSWEEFWEFCKSPHCGIAAEWFAKDKFLAVDDWTKKRDWKKYALRVRGWWDNDGRPMSPPQKQTNGSKFQLPEPTAKQKAAMWGIK